MDHLVAVDEDGDAILVRELGDLGAEAPALGDALDPVLEALLAQAALDGPAGT